MARQTTEQRLIDKHTELLQEFENIQSAQFEVRQQCLADRRFVSVPGAQWEGDLETNWPANKPRFEVNKIQRSLNRIYSEYCNQRIDATFISKDGKDADELADACASIHRSDMQDSAADEAYNNAFSEASSGGMGAWRYKTVMEDEDADDNERQRIAVEAIPDADTSVYFDLNSKRQDKKGSLLCFVLDSVARSSYLTEYDDDLTWWKGKDKRIGSGTPTSMPKAAGQSFFDWCTADVVYIAEVYQVEKRRRAMRVFRMAALDDLLPSDETESEERKFTRQELQDEDLVAELAATGWHEVRVESSKQRRVHKYVMSGGKILEDCGYIVGPNIPVVPVYGKRWFIDNVERFQGQVRLAKDAQRLANMERSKLAEIAAYSTTEKPIFAPEQVVGLQDYWATDNIMNFAYLLAHPLKDANGQIVAMGPMAYTKVPNIPPALAAVLQFTEKDLQDMTGERDSAEEVHSNVSGKAVELTQNRLDMQAYIYISNMAVAIKRGTEIWLGMAKEVYTEEDRVVRGVNEKGAPQALTLMQPTVDKDGKQGHKNDLRNATLDVSVNVGPSSQSRRDATVRGLTSVMSIIQNPQDIEILTASVLQNMEFEGSEAVNKYYRRKLVKLGVETPTPEEAEELQAAAEADAQKPPPADQQFLLAEKAKSEALAQKALADTGLSIAKTEQAMAEAAKTTSDIKIGQLGAQLDVLAAVDSSLEAMNAAQPGQTAGIPQQ